MKINQNQKHDGGGGEPLNNNNSGTGAYKLITFIIDVIGEKQTENIRYVDTEIAINIVVPKVISALYHLSLRILRRLILKLHTETCTFLFSEEESSRLIAQEKTKLVLYRSMRVHGKT